MGITNYIGLMFVMRPYLACDDRSMFTMCFGITTYDNSFYEYGVVDEIVSIFSDIPEHGPCQSQQNVTQNIQRDADITNNTQNTLIPGKVLFMTLIQMIAECIVQPESYRSND